MDISNLPGTAATKLCPRCREHKPVTEFHRHRRRKDGLSTYCKPCGSAVAKASKAAARVPFVGAGVNNAFILRRTDMLAARCFHGEDEECGGYHWRYIGAGNNVPSRGEDRRSTTVDRRLAAVFGVVLAPGEPFWCDDEGLGFACVNPAHGPRAGEVRPPAVSMVGETIADPGLVGDLFETSEAGEKADAAFHFMKTSDEFGISQNTALRLLDTGGSFHPESELDDAASKFLAAAGFNQSGEPSDNVDRENAKRWLRKRGFEVKDEDPDPEVEREEALRWLKAE